MVGSSTYPLEVGIRAGWWDPSSHRSETHYYCWYLVNKSQAGGAKQTLDASGLKDTENRFSSARRWKTDYSAMRALPVTAPCPIGASAGELRELATISEILDGAITTANQAWRALKSQSSGSQQRKNPGLREGHMVYGGCPTLQQRDRGILRQRTQEC